MKNTFGQAVALTIFGESHGPAVGAVLDGLAPGLPVDEDYIRRQLARRRPSTVLDTARQEQDCYQILSGVYQGRTTGSPLTIVIPNENTRSGTIATAWRGPPTRTTPPTANTTAMRTGGAADTFPAVLPRRWWPLGRYCCQPLTGWVLPWAPIFSAAAARGIAPLPRTRRQTWPPCRRRSSPR